VKVSLMGSEDSTPDLSQLRNIPAQAPFSS
jgi:hypothetical protein